MFLGKKRWNYFLPVLKAPKKWMLFFGAFSVFSSCFAVSSASSQKGAQKNYFINFLNTLLKHLVTSCSNK